MVTYKVIKYFTDLQDDDYEYHEGDVYPRDGKKVSEERLTELSTNTNRQGTPLIERVQEQINYYGMKVSELKEIASTRNIDGYNDMKKAELVEVLEGGQ